MTVLVVDDSPIDVRLAAAMFKKAGYETQVAKNGAEALRLVGEAPPELVVTDLAMPEMDGLAVVEELRRSHPQIPVILMTANGSEEIAVRALQAGAASYVPKRDLARALVDTARSILAVREQETPWSTRALAATRWELSNDLAQVAPVVGILEARLSQSPGIDEAARLQIAVALREAIVNAMLHGNLELSSELKEADPIAHDRLAEERRRVSPFRERRVRVTVTETPEAIAYVVTDDGAGFDLSMLPDPTDLANLERTSGRGIFLIRTFMDVVTHEDGGRTIRMVKRKTQD